MEAGAETFHGTPIYHCYNLAFTASSQSSTKPILSWNPAGVEPSNHEGPGWTYGGVLVLIQNTVRFGDHGTNQKEEGYRGRNPAFKKLRMRIGNVTLAITRLHRCIGCHKM